MDNTGEIVCTDLSGKEQPRQVGVDMVIVSGRIGSGMARSVGTNSALDALFIIFITILVCMIWILYKLCAEWLLNLPGIGIHVSTMSVFYLLHLSSNLDYINCKFSVLRWQEDQCCTVPLTLPFACTTVTGAVHYTAGATPLILQDRCCN